MYNLDFKLQNKIGIVANDAGAANLILGWLKNNNSLNYFFCLTGPAKNIYEKENLLTSICTIEEIISKCNLIISGTSFDSTLEHLVRIEAKKAKILSIAVIDHWVNYEIRFIRNNRKVLPDIIWVFDEFAEKKAKKLFRKTKIQKIKNFYMDEIVKKIKFLESKNIYENKSNLLYILEPIRKESSKEDYLYEFEVLDFFINNLKKLNLKKDCSIKLRLHPSEKKEKYNAWLKNKPKNFINISLEKTLEQDIAWADIVIAYESYALVIANAASKRCLSSKLPYEKKCNLMIKDLQYIRDIQ